MLLPVPLNPSGDRAEEVELSNTLGELAAANASAIESWRKGYAEGLEKGRKEALRAVSMQMES
jgi:flagellar biosynthesis/type III secretory pathway protein FliH